MNMERGGRRWDDSLRSIKTKKSLDAGSLKERTSGYLSLLGSWTGWGKLPQSAEVLNGMCSTQGPASISSNLRNGSSWYKRTDSDHLLRAALRGTSNSSLCCQKSSSYVLSSQDKWSHLNLFSKHCVDAKLDTGSTVSSSLILTFSSILTKEWVNLEITLFPDHISSTELALHFLWKAGSTSEMHVISNQHVGTQEVCHVLDPPKVKTKEKIFRDIKEPRERKNRILISVISRTIKTHQLILRNQG